MAIERRRCKQCHFSARSTFLEVIRQPDVYSCFLPPIFAQVSRTLFLEFVRAHPRALLLYLQQGLARLWRVAHFMLSDYLQLQLHNLKYNAPVKQGSPECK